MCSGHPHEAMSFLWPDLLKGPLFSMGSGARPLPAPTSCCLTLLGGALLLGHEPWAGTQAGQAADLSG